MNRDTKVHSMTIPVHIDASRSYEIRIGALTSLTFDTKVLLVTNPKISGLHLANCLKTIHAKELYIHTIPDGEQYKNTQTLEEILNTAFAHRLNRHSLMIALGGGVIGDMVGFASGIFQRGIDFIQIPTTLLAQVDASVGGKTGINTAYGKNLVGLFHQPRAVYLDPAFLTTLPKREFNAGVAEIIKMAVAFDREFFTWLEHHSLYDAHHLQEAIARTVTIKADIVRQDEYESGIRAALNYGHTFGHVIECETRYTQFLHGEAVAIGMVMANTLATQLGTLTLEEAHRIHHLLKSYHLPTDYSICDVLRFYDAFFFDKKSTDSHLIFVLPHGIGEVVLRKDISQAHLLQALKTFNSSNSSNKSNAC
jgi:3-dehydroquinate synthase